VSGRALCIVYQTFVLQTQIFLDFFCACPAQVSATKCDRLAAQALAKREILANLVQSKGFLISSPYHAKDKVCTFGRTGAGPNTKSICCLVADFASFLELII
jgi:hypothetical protein